MWQGDQAPAGRSTLPVLHLFCIKWHNSRHLLQSLGTGAATNQVKAPESLHYSIAQHLQTGIDRPSHSGVVADFNQTVPYFTWLRCKQITFQSHYVTFEFVGKSNLRYDRSFSNCGVIASVSSPSFTLRVMTRSGHRCLTVKFYNKLWDAKAS